ncbi:MAG: hypothetical protein H6810_01135 [Phycisphaeraceae bacterium]|nr:MAG: hypothetical protein H6810_01135 [Phycisphaeraceae bacterium]
MTTPTPPRRLRDLHPLARFGLICVVLTLLGGATGAGLQLYFQLHNRDEKPERFTIDDVKAQYHGIRSPSPLLESLESGHPADVGGELPDNERQALLDWLKGDRISRNYDNLDLGDMAPSEIMTARCVDCHNRQAKGEHAAAKMPLEYWDDVDPLSVSREINPVPIEVLAASTHTHALGLSALTLVLCWLALLTSWRRWLVALIVGFTGLGLMMDIGSWWLTREYVGFAWAVVAGGGLYNLGVGLLGLLVILDLLAPAGKKRADS